MTIKCSVQYLKESFSVLNLSILNPSPGDSEASVMLLYYDKSLLVLMKVCFSLPQTSVDPQCDKKKIKITTQ